MRSQYDHIFADIKTDVNYNRNSTSNDSAIPYHARENSLPFSYGPIKPKSTTTKLNENVSYNTMNSIGSVVNTNNQRDNYTRNEFGLNNELGIKFDDFQINEKLNSNTLSYKSNQNVEETMYNQMMKPHSRLTSPLLVRKTFTNSIIKPTQSVDAFSNNYSYNSNGYKKNIDKENELDRVEFDSGYKTEIIAKNVPYVTLNGTLDKPHNNNIGKNMASLIQRSQTPHNYEEFENLLLRRSDKVENDHGNINYINNTKIKNDTKTKKFNNYDIEFNLLNFVDEQNHNGFSGFLNYEPPTPPTRNYTLEVAPKTSQRNHFENNYKSITLTRESKNDNDRHTTPLPALSVVQTIPSNKLKSYVGSTNMVIDNSERPLLELNVGYKKHSETLQKQNEQWPDYNTIRTITNYGSNATAYGNGNVVHYHTGKSNSAKEADINNQFDSIPIYATSMRNQRHQPPHDENIYKISRFCDDIYRPETPAFPVTPRTLSQPTTLEREASNNYQSLLRSEMNSSETQEVAAHLVKFAKDSSQFWYKPNLSREEAIGLLINETPGTFIIRDSTTYKNAYGLVLRVAQPPPGAPSTGKLDDLVRHFLIEPTTRGVRLKGCTNEPVFTSLSALVYEHSINQLALPCLLHLPEHDLLPPSMEPTPDQQQLLTQGAACNVLLLFSADTESLTGEEAIRKAIRQMYDQEPLTSPIEVHFKCTQLGITLTDNTRKRFFRKHYRTDSISYCAIDPDNRVWSILDAIKHSNKTIFAFVARRSPSSKDNQCHIFCDLESNQPASAIVSFVNKTLSIDKQRNFKL